MHKTDLPTQTQVNNWVQEIADTYAVTDPNLPVSVIFDHIKKLIVEAGFQPDMYLPEGYRPQEWGHLSSLIYAEVGIKMGWF